MNAQDPMGNRIPHRPRPSPILPTNGPIPPSTQRHPNPQGQHLRRRGLHGRSGRFEPHALPTLHPNAGAGGRAEGRRWAARGGWGGGYGRDAPVSGRVSGGDLSGADDRAGAGCVI